MPPKRSSPAPTDEEYSEAIRRFIQTRTIQLGISGSQSEESKAQEMIERWKSLALAARDLAFSLKVAEQGGNESVEKLEAEAIEFRNKYDNTFEVREGTMVFKSPGNLWLEAACTAIQTRRRFAPSLGGADQIQELGVSLCCAVADLQRILRQRGIEERARELRHGDVGRLPDMALDEYVKWGKEHGVGAHTLAVRLVKVGIDPGPTELPAELEPVNPELANQALEWENARNRRDLKEQKRLKRVPDAIQKWENRIKKRLSSTG